MATTERARASPTQAQSGSFETLGEARATLEAQIEAHLQSGLPSPELLRARIFTLLTRSLQRELFFSTAGRGARGLAACRALFGAPPYTFLRPGDAAALSARGFAAGRVRMTYEDAAGPPAPTYAQFGSPHYEDEDGRQLRFMQPPESSPDTPTSVLALEQNPVHVDFALRLPRKRAASGAGEQRAGFPAPNARLRLHLQPVLRAALGLRADAVGELEIRILDIQSASVLRGRPMARDAVALVRAALLDVRATVRGKDAAGLTPLPSSRGAGSSLPPRPAR